MIEARLGTRQACEGESAHVHFSKTSLVYAFDLMTVESLLTCRSGLFPLDLSQNWNEILSKQGQSAIRYDCRQLASPWGRRLSYIVSDSDSEALHNRRELYAIMVYLNRMLALPSPNAFQREEELSKLLVNSDDS